MTGEQPQEKSVRWARPDHAGPERPGHEQWEAIRRF